MYNQRRKRPRDKVNLLIRPALIVPMAIIVLFSKLVVFVLRKIYSLVAFVWFAFTSSSVFVMGVR